MLLKFGKESVDIQWKHVTAYLFSIIILAIAASALLLLLSFIIKKDFLDPGFYGGIVWSLGYLTSVILAYVIYLFYRNFSQKDLVAIAIVSFILYLGYFVIINLIDYLVTPGFNFDIYLIFVGILDSPFSAAFLYLALVFIYEKAWKNLGWIAIVFASIIALIAPFLFTLLSYIETYSFILPELNQILLVEAFFAYVIIAYIVLRKGKIHNMIYASAVLLMLRYLFEMIIWDNKNYLTIIYYPVFFALIYLAGRWLVENKDKKLAI